jgi:hypothetical protein
MASQERTNVVISGATTHNELVAAVAGYKIRVLSYVLVNAVTKTVLFNSFDGATTYTALSGVMTLTAGYPCVNPLQRDGIFETISGEALDLQLGAETQCSGHLTYSLIAA